MPFTAGQTTREMRGLLGRAGSRDFVGANHARLFWVASDDETVTPGSGEIPAGAFMYAWEPFLDDQACSLFTDQTTNVGTFAVESGTPLGYLHVWYRSGAA